MYLSDIQHDIPCLTAVSLSVDQKSAFGQFLKVAVDDPPKDLFQVFGLKDRLVFVFDVEMAVSDGIFKYVRLSCVLNLRVSSDG